MLLCVDHLEFKGVVCDKKLDHMPRSVEVLWKTVAESHLRQKSGKISY
jgi:hypothetical protein